MMSTFRLERSDGAKCQVKWSNDRKSTPVWHFLALFWHFLGTFLALFSIRILRIYEMDSTSISEHAVTGMFQSWVVLGKKSLQSWFGNNYKALFRFLKLTPKSARKVPEINISELNDFWDNARAARPQKVNGTPSWHCPKVSCEATYLILPCTFWYFLESILRIYKT